MKKLTDIWRNSKLRYKLMLWDIHGPLFQWSDREKMILEALRFVRANQVKGDYFELGIGEGYTFATAIRLAQQLKLSEMNFRGFDSFEGLPETKDIDISEQFKQGQYVYTYEVVLKQLPRWDGHIYLHKGWFDEVFSHLYNLPMNWKVAIAWIDCDLYHSTMPVLEWLTPRLQQGSVLCFDDYNCFKGSPFRGQQLAFRTWSTEHETELGFTEFLPFGWHGKSFIVHRVA